jgi:hypothetical protein
MFDIAREHYREFRFSRTIDVAATRWEADFPGGIFKRTSDESVDELLDVTCSPGRAAAARLRSSAGK